MNRKILTGIAYVAFISLVILLSTLLWKHHSKNQIHDLPGILNSGRLSVLTDSRSIGFSIKGDSVSGFQYEIVKAFADSLGLELVISEKNDLKDCMDGLNSGDYDIIANFMPVTTEWKQMQFNFTGAWDDNSNAAHPPAPPRKPVSWSSPQACR